MPTRFLRSVVASTYNASQVPTPYPGYDVDATVPPWALSWAALWDAEKDRNSYYPSSSGGGSYYGGEGSYTVPGQQPQIIIVPMPAGTPTTGVDDGTGYVDETDGLPTGTPQAVGPYPQYPTYPTDPYGTGGYGTGGYGTGGTGGYGTNPYGTGGYGVDPYGTGGYSNYPGLTDFGEGTNIFEPPETPIEEPAPEEKSGASPLWGILPAVAILGFWQRKRIKEWYDKRAGKTDIDDDTKVIVKKTEDLPVITFPDRRRPTVVQEPVAHPVHVVRELPEARVSRPVNSNVRVLRPRATAPRRPTSRSRVVRRRVR